MSAARSVPTASSGKSITASARRYALTPATRSCGKDGASAGGRSRTATTRAATRALSSGVSPGNGTKVPVDWSLAIFSAIRTGSSVAVSIR